MKPAASAYLLDNASDKAGARMDVLSRLFDAPTQRVLERVGLAPGWRCLEIGGGGGSIARWMAGRVGPTGHVLCTDLDTRLIEEGRASAPGNLEVIRHDIASDPLPADAFDLIHARLVFLHVVERERALERVVQALKPGGWLVIEDFDTASVTPDARINRFETPLPTSEAVRRYLTRNQDGHFGRRLFGRFRELGLTQVDAEGRSVMFTRFNGGADLMRVNFEQIGEDVIAAGLITQQQIDADLAMIQRDDFAIPSPTMWSVVGRR
ncbi:MAG TPA: methyltransferase domain-containing protein [Steroidobacteraceae bacterium]|jgi:ubiquinone/menaquinone biosynthesis C-methylase UbiE|nr:methyltransferase domain-containing protein [Steroidobacteraceae bacterium]